MKFEELKLLPGTPLQLQFHHAPDTRERSLLVGYLKNKGLVISTPMVKGSPRPVKVGQKLNVRFFSSESGSAVAFSSQAIHVTVAPFPQVYLAYPSEIATGEVRKAVRVATDLIATVKIGGGDSLSMSIVDLSTSGCRVESARSLGTAGDRIILLTKVEAAGSQHILQLPSVIKIVMDDESSAGVRSYGLAFEDLSAEVNLILHAYVYYHLGHV
ncbi:MAG: flagellar brake protein [Pseudohongiellaceae bacterium]|nr:flagellar brake protein [Pseudohongiellaceae bacterium]